jgi:hypothetical protein
VPARFARTLLHAVVLQILKLVALYGVRDITLLKL